MHKEVLRLLAFDGKKLLKNKSLMLSVFIIPFVFAILMGCVSIFLEEDGETASYAIYVYKMPETLTGMEINGQLIPVIEISDGDELLLGQNIPEGSVVILYDQKKILYKSSDAMSVNLMQMVRLEFHLEEFVMEFQPECISVSVQDISNGQGQFVRILLLLIPYMILPILYGSVSSVILEFVSAERERGTFARTLLAPIGQKSLMVSKLLFSTFIGIFEVLLYMLVLWGKEAIGRKTSVSAFQMFEGISPDPIGISLILLSLLLCAGLFSLIAFGLSLKANSYKENQSYNVIIIVIILLLGFLSTLRVGKIQEFYYVIPIYNVCLFYQDLMNGSADFLPGTLALISTFFYVGLALFADLKMMRKEECVF